ncbi:MAG: D-glycerate dehydrogenase [Burkholderiales bacterium]|nr:D-glycerate dehydrogenase [Anaerolineae bacterium]
MKPKVFVTRAIFDAGLDLVRAACDANVWEEDRPIPRDILLERVRGVEGILSLLTERMDGEVMDAAGPQLKVISQFAVGYDNVDVPAARERGIKIGNTPGVLTDATADIAFALLLATGRRIVEGADYVRAGHWKTWGPALLLGQDVTGATLGIVGLGRIGQAMARRAAGFDMKLLAYGPRLTDEEAAEVGAKRVSLDELLRESDYVSLHCPLNADTRHLMNRETFAKMKPTSILINTTRGPVVDQAALIEAIENKVIGGAGLDVTDPEPLPADNPLLTFPNVVVVPHIGSASVRTRNKMAEMSALNLIAGVTGQPLPNEVK